MITYKPMESVEFKLTIMKTHSDGTMPNRYNVKLSYKDTGMDTFTHEEGIPFVIPSLYQNLLEFIKNR